MILKCICRPHRSDVRRFEYLLKMSRVHNTNNDIRHLVYGHSIPTFRLRLLWKTFLNMTEALLGVKSQSKILEWKKKRTDTVYKERMDHQNNNYVLVMIRTWQTWKILSSDCKKSRTHKKM